MIILILKVCELSSNMVAETYLLHIFMHTHTHTYVVWQNDLLIHTMLLDEFILLESFVTPAGISMGIKLRTEFFPYYE